jgi:glyoxylase-like metal-dependent hydrolase (beta-lactamase superfamily II)
MLSRRHFLSASIAAAAVTVAGVPAIARAPLSGKQVAGIYRYKLGSTEVTAISDGSVGLNTQVFAGADQAELKRIIAAYGQADLPPTAVNAFIVNTGQKTYLIDTGAGTSKAFGNTLGKMRDNLAAAGIQPSQIDAVILPRAAPDGVIRPSA